MNLLQIFRDANLFISILDISFSSLSKNLNPQFFIRACKVSMIKAATHLTIAGFRFSSKQITN